MERKKQVRRFQRQVQNKKYTYDFDGTVILMRNQEEIEERYPQLKRRDLSLDIRLENFFFARNGKVQQHLKKNEVIA